MDALSNAAGASFAKQPGKYDVMVKHVGQAAGDGAIIVLLLSMAFDVGRAAAVAAAAAA